MIHIVDYDAGNVRSVERSFKHFGKETVITRDLHQLAHNDLLVLPGVGSFGHAVKSLKASGCFEKIRDHIRAARPFLGICLGLQLLFESSEENPGVSGLAVLEGTVKRFQPTNQLCVPQIGWNTLDIRCEAFKEFQGNYFYFVHSYYVVPEDKTIPLSFTEYGQTYVSAVIKDQLIATQFHPEKSGEVGLAFMQAVMEYFRIP